ncbi:chromatin structure remodeling complex protein RSC3 [Aspergillus heteromorphus CBS 117.55]|uniref:Chromatin structure remodeling complex protein RSC3 n=1 Tax=Aspergillus heteromorphus CBS 117.55 TaxID=1448321 RepID=A0A317WTE0_9EURO|nr:chromatin structure remodeling complex protein RSC3 [Aspergillus heteromorphus CBS 117.55]PWY88198.1 chromatin structure remodeling complex protein RSC3 [Aspergillus heteromorphus CBS 117.55]
MSAPRRNGQLSSCEPCRKSKLRCDHSTPTCLRCTRRGRSELCVYHPAPMTKPHEPARVLKATATSSAIKRKTKTASASASPPQMLVPAKSMAAWASTTASTTTLLASAQFPNPTKRPFSGTGFLGPTSYSGAFSAGDEVSVSVELEPTNQSAPKSTPIDPQQVARGAQVLFLLENLDFYEEISEKRFLLAPGWILGPPLLRGLLGVLRKVYRNATQGSEDKNKYARLADLSRVFFRNTATPIETRAEMPFAEYVDIAAPRWETVGLLFAFVGAATYQVPQHDLGLKHAGETSKEGLRHIAIQASEACWQFCNSLGTISDPLAWALTQHTVFLCWMYGSSDHRTWQMLGEITTTVFALGLHQPDTDSKTPFFLSEIRKRTMVGAYALDKDIATFLGRPPRICWRYCNIQYPLDMSYEEIVAEPAIRDRAIQRLDAAGWNRDGHSNKGARARGVLIATIHQENVLEVSLSNQLDGLEERIETVFRKSDELRQTLPPFFRWTEDTDDIYVMCLHIDFINHEFLLLQTLFKRIGKGRDRLVAKSREMINLLLQMVTMETRSGKVQPSIIMDLCSAGLPAAGVLCTELLRRSQPQPQPQPQLQSHPQPQIDTTFPFPRSEIIQKLSVFLAQLTTFLRQQEGDYEICVKGQKIISQVLDRVLAPPTLPVEMPVDSENGHGLLLDGTTTLGEGDAMGQDVEFMAFLENFDWETEMRLTFG